jgi:pyruvate/2-oxoglutarate dehydrogenase complex dihydrolipoamide dehydrogenase (E3) component
MKSEFKKVSIIGLGYIGLPTAALFAGNGDERSRLSLTFLADRIMPKGDSMSVMNTEETNRSRYRNFRTRKHR